VKLVPVIVTLVPPARGPSAGVTAVMVTASPVAVKVIGDPSSPAAEAVSVFVPAVDPSVQLPTVATPDAFVVWFAPVIEPPPDATAKVTGVPATGFALPSVTLTDGAGLTTAPAAACPLLPPFSAIVVAPPGGSTFPPSPQARASEAIRPAITTLDLFTRCAFDEDAGWVVIPYARVRTGSRIRDRLWEPTQCRLMYG
jgi:hypothetical protein